MRTVKQRGSSDCGIAAVANAVGTSYAAVKMVYGNIRGGMYTHEVRWILSKFGEWKESACVLRKRQSPSLWAKRHPTGTYVVELAVFLDNHLIAVVDGEILGHYVDEWHVVRFWKKT